MNEEYESAGGLQTRIELQERLGQHPREWSAWLFDHFELPDRSLILELAAGSGDYWQRNAGRIPAGWRLTLSDIAPAMVEAARQALAEVPLAASWRFAVADTQAIPAPSGAWDAVVANGVFDYLPAPGRAAALGEVRRVLRAGGLLYTVTGGRGHLEQLEALVRPFVPDVDYGGDPEAFGLETGAAQLSSFFEDVRLFRYDDTLVFKSPEPLMAYLLSEAEVRNRLARAERDRLANAVEERLRGHGPFEVALHKGLFVARRA